MPVLINPLMRTFNYSEYVTFITVFRFGFFPGCRFVSPVIIFIEEKEIGPLIHHPNRCRFKGNVSFVGYD